ncbi:hypothetical protein BAUCODRAFT_34550 [Baudoinia panamericana UAMH 10762]|uniref:Uncharacterized protein n=1 Tax=Baudoinia panamericana (strain UAMH 10762) TaxID=717646 RepID=M2NAA2_BAUPA|nr:uncharacterized protein BAUCODRAFT_34550 [Baudoinia panamericana UAMH 10762]EMC95785.1 hypothetical protein BAUCODRAFT_34550 [Baudoinia panamericana UAMH 10762]
MSSDAPISRVPLPLAGRNRRRFGVEGVVISTPIPLRSETITSLQKDNHTEFVQTYCLRTPSAPTA